MAIRNGITQPRKHSVEQYDNRDKKRQKTTNKPSPNLRDTLAALDLKVSVRETGVYLINCYFESELTTILFGQNLPSYIVPIKNPNNKTGFRGVCNYKNSAKPWRSEIVVGGRTVTLGFFETVADAGKMYGKCVYAQKILSTMTRLAHCDHCLSYSLGVRNMSRKRSVSGYLGTARAAITTGYNGKAIPTGYKGKASVIGYQGMFE